ncbi:MAG: hypothetical protein AAF135_24200 [Bacteroidota bacterium]
MQSPSLYQTLRDHISQDEIEEAFHLLSQEISTRTHTKKVKRIRNELLLLKNQWSSWSKREGLGLEPPQKEKNQIHFQLLKLVDEWEELDKNGNIPEISSSNHRPVKSQSIIIMLGIFGIISLITWGVYTVNKNEQAVETQQNNNLGIQDLGTPDSPTDAIHQPLDDTSYLAKEPPIKEVPSPFPVPLPQTIQGRMVQLLIDAETAALQDLIEARLGPKIIQSKASYSIGPQPDIDFQLKAKLTIDQEEKDLLDKIYQIKFHFYLTLIRFDQEPSVIVSHSDFHSDEMTILSVDQLNPAFHTWFNGLELEIE